jgi:hypothetical protein
VELLPRSRPDELDRDLLVGFVAGERDHVARQVEDPNRLTHLQHEDLAGAGAEISGADYELNGLGDRHEIAGHLRVGDGHRPAPLDLAAEDRDHAPRRSQHVAEAHCDEPGPRVTTTGCLDDPLGERLRGAHHRPRRDSLVG